MRSVLVACALALVLAGTAYGTEQETPRERALQARVAKLSRTNAHLTRKVAALQKQVTALQTDFASQRDLWKAETTRLKSLIANEVHGLANAWRNDNNPKTEVSYYESGGNYWSYTFTWCGFC